jgi:hypothetical protein
MAKLKVGDIIIDHGTVTFHGSPGVAHLASSPLSQPLRSTNSTLQLLRRLPIHGPYLVAGGVGGVLIGLLLTSLSWSPMLSPEASLFRGTPFCFLGLGMIALGVTKIIVDKTQRQMQGNYDDILQQRMARLRPLLATISPYNTVEYLTKTAHMTEEAVVDTLFIMQKQEMIEEDLNFENAEWYYYLSNKERNTKEQTKYMTLEQRRRV